jgi:hypothetical protein
MAVGRSIYPMGMMKGKMKVEVNADGTVQAEKHSRMDMLDFDLG